MGKLICRICKPSKVTMALNNKYLPQSPMSCEYALFGNSHAISRTNLHRNCFDAFDSKRQLLKS